MAGPGPQIPGPKPPEYVRCRDMMLYVVVWSLKEAMAAKAAKKRPKRAK